MLSKGHRRRIKACSFGLDDFQPVVMLRPDDDRYATLDYAGLLSCNFLDRFSKKLLVVEVYLGDDGQNGTVHHVCGIVTPAKADFQQGPVGGDFRKCQKGRHCRDLEIRDRFATVGHVDIFEKLQQVPFGDDLSRHADSLMKPG